jgi:AcrR family transcriptional regulator
MTSVQFVPMHEAARKTVKDERTVMLTAATLRRNVDGDNIVGELKELEERAYHHGNLRAALLATAARQLEQSGVEALSLRDLANSLGVSHAAPYRHFADRRAMLAALAADGFRRFEAQAQAALAKQATPAARLQAGARAYLAFATRHPQLFRLMFVSDLLGGDKPREPALAQVANHFHSRFEALVGENCSARSDKTIKAATLTFWSILHGFALLRMGKRLLPNMLGALTEVELLDAVLKAATAIPTSVPPLGGEHVRRAARRRNPVKPQGA